MKKAKIISFVILVLIRFSSFAQTEILTNESIIELQKNKFSKSFIINKINTSACNFELTTEKLIALKKAKVSEDVINEMLKKESKPKTEEAVEVPKKTTTTNVVKTESSKPGYKPPTNLSSGIYYQNNTTKELVELDPSVYSQSKSGSGIITSITYGFAKTKSKSVLTGAAANLQIANDSLPNFYFYFDKNRTSDLGENLNTSSWFVSATTPNEFTLVKLLVTKKGNSREVVTGSYNIEGGTSGVDETQNFGYKYEKVSPGIYRVYFLHAIKPGEYCFMYAGTGATNKVYDFGIAK